ncbi:PLP-dependent transferase [Aerococcaceae bacterium WGS1372]
MTYNLHTQLVQLGNGKDPLTGAISSPIHLSATYAHPGLGQSTGYDYTRTKNPTRNTLEEGLAVLEGGARSVVTSSGMSAVQLIFQLFNPGAKFFVSRDLYGGSFRYFEHLEAQGLASFAYFDSEEELATLVNEDGAVDAIFIETPTNPLMREVDIEAIAKVTKEVGALLIVDNTLLTPLRQRPLDLGADLVIHSATKYLTGHNDILAGVVVAKDADIGEKLFWLSNTTGSTLSPFDCWLFIRSLKTLAVRLDRQEATARELVKWLESQDRIQATLYAGQGAMISIRLASEDHIGPFLENLKVFTYAESLGGVESLITYPTTQTHADIPQDLRESYGLTPDLLRLSIGLEDPQDLINDIQTALDATLKG